MHRAIACEILISVQLTGRSRYAMCVCCAHTRARARALSLSLSHARAHTHTRISSEGASGNLARACGGDGLQPCPTAQSSTDYGGISLNAVDGNTNVAFGEGSCTHTQTESNAWWRVDLETTRSVKSVKIWNRADSPGASGRLEGFEVWIGFDASSYSANLRCLAGGTAPLNPPHEVHVSCIGTGRYLFVALPGSDRVLNMCEVEVYGMQGERSCLRA